LLPQQFSLNEMDKDKNLEIYSKLHYSHENCIVCGKSNPYGLKLSFKLEENGSVEAEFETKSVYQGYKGLLQGGVAAAIMDSAMTNCLFYHGISAFTAEFSIKYKKPIPCGKKIIVRAKIEKSYNPLHILSSTISQNDMVLVEASAKFMESDLLKKN